jgi:hypothetical protein
MQLPRFVGLVDLGIATVVVVAVLLPAREMYASSAFKGDDAAQFAIAFAEARSMARPDDGRAVEELSRKVGEVGFKDWAIENAVAGSERAKQAPNRWRALLAASVAYVDRLDVKPALDFANRAIAACESAQEASTGPRDYTAACPDFEKTRMGLYQQDLDAGVKSGIDPRRDPKGFRAAGEKGLHSIWLKSNDHDRANSAGSGHGSGNAGAGSATGSNNAP